MKTLTSDEFQGCETRRPENYATGRVRNFLATIILLVLVFVSPPLFFLERYSLTQINKPIILGSILALAIIFFHRLTISKTAAQLSFLQIVQASALLMLPFLHMTFGYGLDAGYFSLSFQILAGLALFLVLANADQVGMFAKFWVNLHLVIGALGLLVFMGGLAFNLQPLGTFMDRPYYDFGLTYTNVFYQVGDIKLIRVAGFYDEPGTFAFYTTFAILIARLFGMPKWREVLLVIFGLTSLSMAFFVVVFVWAMLTVNRHHIKYLLLAVAVLTIALGRLDTEVRDYAYSITIDRFSISRSGDRLVKGDSRTPIMKDNYRAFTDAPVIGHGLHYDDYVRDEYSWSFIVNPMAPFATHGVLGALIVNLHVVVLLVVLLRTRRLKRRDKAMLIVVLLATLAQRPVTINGFGYILFIIMIYQLTAESLSGSRKSDVE